MVGSVGFDKDFYQTIGAKGGKNSHRSGFALNPERARAAGKVGGQKSRRGKSVRRYEVLIFDQLENDIIKRKLFVKKDAVLWFLKQYRQNGEKTTVKDLVGGGRVTITGCQDRFIILAKALLGML